MFIHTPFFNIILLPQRKRDADSEATDGSKVHSFETKILRKMLLLYLHADTPLVHILLLPFVQSARRKAPLLPLNRFSEKSRDESTFSLSLQCCIIKMREI